MENKQHMNQFIQNGINLSEREIEIINLIADGFNYKQIAEKLFLSPDTISSHKKNIFSKLKAKNSANMVKIAMQKKICR